MKTNYKTVHGLTTNYIKTIATAEASHGDYLKELAKRGVEVITSGDEKSMTKYANELLACHTELKKAFEETGISTFKKVASIVGRMYVKSKDKKAVKVHLTVKWFELASNSDYIAMSFAELIGLSLKKAVKVDGKEKVIKSVKKATDDLKVDVKEEVKSVKDEIIDNASNLVRMSQDDLTDTFYALVDSLEEQLQNFDVSKNTATTATAIATMQKLSSIIGG